jgi:glycosyltransferase involved in cell wall biosynthesis
MNVNYFGRTYEFSSSFERMPKQSDITIVIPAYNPSPEFLRLTLASALSQDFDGSTSVTIVDDGSREPISSIPMDLFADQRVTLIRQENKGPSEARNLGVILSQSPVIVGLDADDILLPNACTSLYKGLSEYKNAVLAYGDGMFIGTIPKSHQWPHKTPSVVDYNKRTNVWCKPEFDKNLLLEFMYIGHPQMYKREALLTIGGYEPEYRSAQDWDFALKMSEIGDFVHVPEVLHLYNYNADNISSRTKAEEQLRREQKMVAKALGRRGIFDFEKIPANVQQVLQFTPDLFKNLQAE